MSRVLDALVWVVVGVMLVVAIWAVVTDAFWVWAGVCVLTALLALTAKDTP